MGLIAGSFVFICYSSKFDHCFIQPQTARPTLPVSWRGYVSVVRFSYASEWSQQSPETSVLCVTLQFSFCHLLSLRLWQKLNVCPPYSNQGKLGWRWISNFTARYYCRHSEASVKINQLFNPKCKKPQLFTSVNFSRSEPEQNPGTLGVNYSRSTGFCPQLSPPSYNCMENCSECTNTTNMAERSRLVTQISWGDS